MNDQTSYRELRALSVKQPNAELIVRGIQKVERRTLNTKIRGKILIYASKGKSSKSKFDQNGIEMENCDFGLIIGEVYITDVYFKVGMFYWILDRAVKYPTPLKPQKQTKPLWFYPF